MRIYGVSWSHRDQDQLGADINLFTDKIEAVKAFEAECVAWELDYSAREAAIPAPENQSSAGSVLRYADDAKSEYDAESVAIELRVWDLKP